MRRQHTEWEKIFANHIYDEGLPVITASVTIRKTHIKTTERDHLTPVRMSTPKMTRTTSGGRDAGKREPLCTIGGNANWCSHVENSMETLQKIKH